MEIDHRHAHDSSNYGRAFAGITLNLGFIVAEAVYRILAHSIALLADAALVVVWGASLLACRKPSRRYT